MPKSVAMFDPADGGLLASDLLYVLQGLGIDRDRKLTLQQLFELCISNKMPLADLPWNSGDQHYVPTWLPSAPGVESPRGWLNLNQLFKDATEHNMTWDLEAGSTTVDLTAIGQSVNVRIQGQPPAIRTLALTGSLPESKQIIFWVQSPTLNKEVRIVIDGTIYAILRGGEAVRIHWVAGEAVVEVASPRRPFADATDVAPLTGPVVLNFFEELGLDGDGVMADITGQNLHDVCHGFGDTQPGRIGEIGNLRATMGLFGADQSTRGTEITTIRESPRVRVFQMTLPNGPDQSVTLALEELGLVAIVGVQAMANTVSGKQVPNNTYDLDASPEVGTWFGVEITPGTFIPFVAPSVTLKTSVTSASQDIFGQTCYVLVSCIIPSQPNQLVP